MKRLMKFQKYEHLRALLVVKKRGGHSYMWSWLGCYIRVDSSDSIMWQTHGEYPHWEYPGLRGCIHALNGMLLIHPTPPRATPIRHREVATMNERWRVAEPCTSLSS